VVNGQTILRAESYVWTDSGLLKVSTTDVTVDGNKQWQIKWDGSVGITNYSEVQINGSAHTKTNLVINADQSRTSSGYVYGQLLNVASQNGSGQSLGSSTYTYDEHGRQKTVTDARNGTISYEYNNADQVTQVTTPVPGIGQSAQTTATYYDDLGRVAQVNYADGTYVTNEYYASGELKKVLGSRASPVEYTYDSQGRVKTFKTWRESGNENTAATTTWNYNDRGLLLSKVYADNSSISNFYTTGGRLYERVNGRNIKSVYTYNTAGDLYSVTYNDTNLTPGYTNSYDRLGQLTNVVRDSVSTAFAYNNLGQLLAESQSGGLLDTVKTTNFFDSLRRCTGIQALKGSTVLSDVDYGYESGSSRLSSVTSGDKAITYSYHANSSLVHDIVSAQGSTTRLTIAKEFDFLNRLTSITSRGSSSLPLSSFAYEYDSANRRTRSVLADGSYWMYEYDSLGQLKNGKRYWSDFSPVAGQQYEYDHDLIGNRKTTGAGGNAQGSGLRQASYGVDAANKYSQRDVPSYADIIGMGSVNAAILVNSQRTERHAEYYRLELGILGKYSDLGSPFSVLRTYTWGLDLSGTSQGAGGVGGLLIVSDGSTTQTNHFTCFDGNGNIVALINAADGSVTARYEYGPFGEAICITGPSTGSMAKSNPFRFSTKYSDDETDLVYYGHRYYSTSLGRWISRDPIQEQGGFNLYGFVVNNSVNNIDMLGLESIFVESYFRTLSWAKSISEKDQIRFDNCKRQHGLIIHAYDIYRSYRNGKSGLYAEELILGIIRLQSQLDPQIGSLIKYWKQLKVLPECLWNFDRMSRYMQKYGHVDNSRNILRRNVL